MFVLSQGAYKAQHDMTSPQVNLNQLKESDKTPSTPTKMPSMQSQLNFTVVERM